MSEHTPLTEAERESLWEKRCVFCPIIEGDAPATVIERGERHVAFVPLGPHVPGHVLFVPTQHLPDATVNPEAAAVVFAEAARYVAEQGFAANIITSIGTAATQSVPHLHLHVVPRGANDWLDTRWPWLAARTSTATADTEGCWQPCDPDCEVGPIHCEAVHLPSHKAKTVLHTAECDAATADTGLRERVEALAEAWSADWSGHDAAAPFARALRAALDATAAPTADTEADQ